MSGERKRASTETHDVYGRFERSHGTFERSFALPRDARTEDIQARFENGVLEILVPKVEVIKARALEIKKNKGGLFSRLFTPTKTAPESIASH